MPDQRVIMDNDELYQRFPSVHQFALENFDEINEENYPAVEAWEVTVNSKNEVTGVVKPIFADWYQREEIQSNAE